MYGKTKKRKKKSKQKKKVSGGKKVTTGSMNGTNDGLQNEQNNDKSPPQPPSIIKRNSSFQDFTVKAPKIAANTAAKIVTGVDMNGMARSQRNIQQMEEQEQQRDFVQNSMGQAVFVGRNAVDSVGERRLSGSSKGGLSPKGEENLDDLLADVFTAAPPAEVGDPVVKDPEMGFCNDENEISDDDNELSDGVDETELGDKIYSHPQDRGNPFLGWISWTLNLSYDRMLRGIPGTGTRDGGMSGQLLAVNLDAIILFKFHALCLRVTVMACIICLGIILPLNLTACDPADKICRYSTSYSGENTTTPLTNYGRTTIANIPFNAENDTWIMSLSKHVFTKEFWKNSKIENMARLYAIAVCTWIIYFFALRNIKKEWKENLVLRRVYYLEADHYGKRQTELDKTIYLPRDEADGEDSDDEMDIKKRRSINKTGGKSSKYKNRQPWIPDPEHRDTVPNIELYSVLVGGLPSLPNEVVNKTDMDTAVQASERSNVDWQLAVATTFFDHCVPNQPGFSSSVVAVTILPGAKELAKSWRKWYAAAAALRRLRFIRNVIKEKRHYSIDDVEVDYEEDEGNPSDVLSGGESTESKPKVTFLDEETAAFRFQDLESNRQAAQYRQTFGETQNASEMEANIFRSLNIGPEQQAVYSREMAQGAAACCPNGCCEGRVRRKAIDRLLEMEDAAIERLTAAQRELNLAQKEAAVSIKEKNDSGKPGEAENGNETEMMMMRAENDVASNGAPSGEVKPKAYFMKDDDGCQRDSSHSIPAQQYSVTSPRSSPKGSNSQPRMNSEGKFFFQTSEEEESLSAGEQYFDNAFSVRRRLNTSQSESSMRRRANTGQSSLVGACSIRSPPSILSQENTSATGDQWDRVNTILQSENPDHFESERTKNIETGVWEKPSIKSMMSGLRSGVIAGVKAVGRWTKSKSDPIASSLAKHSTYAVVTFSSRQAAVAARHCLNDGRGQQRWLSLENIPVPPLADAAPCDIITCRGCCRPVTLNINQNEQLSRKYCAKASLIFIYIFYTVPITTAQKLVEPASLQKTFPGLYNLLEANENGFLSANILSGLVGALLYTTFFALCPVLFKSIANSGGQATSVQEAEVYALRYYWGFMLVTAFVLTAFADAAIQIWNSSELEDTVQTMLKNIAANTPLGVSGIWLNWIIVRTTMTLPLQYLITVNSFIFDCIGWKCCARCVMGGGPGGPIPYRIYIDGGVVFLCVVALAPQSPLVAAAALLYYFFCSPLWRRNCIFLYRPRFDSGGDRWPFLSDMLISSLFMGQLLLTLQMVLRDAFGPALIAVAPAIPTYLYRRNIKKRFERAYKDAGLLQMSLLDGWDNSIATTVEKREEFRKFLVDAHKAAYIPVCIAGGATHVLTAEPAVVVASDNDDMLGYSDVIDNGFRPQNPQDHLSPYFGDQAPVFFSGNNTNGNGASAATAATPSRTIMTRRTKNVPSGSFSPTSNGKTTPHLYKTPWHSGDHFDGVPQNLEDQGCTQS